MPTDDGPAWVILRIRCVRTSRRLMLNFTDSIRFVSADSGMAFSRLVQLLIRRCVADASNPLGQIDAIPISAILITSSAMTVERKIEPQLQLAGLLWRSANALLRGLFGHVFIVRKKCEKMQEEHLTA